MTEQIERIKAKLYDLKTADRSFRIFGSTQHGYRLLPVLPETKIAAFEQQFNIRLPESYRCFLMKVSGGGAGPCYGLESLENVLYADLDRKTGAIDPGKEFTFTGPWNINSEPQVGEYDEDATRVDDKEYFDPKWCNGMVRICNYGCGVSINLVVNGSECGNIWIDTRVSDQGISPLPNGTEANRITFLDWYETWLDESLIAIHSKSVAQNNVRPPAVHDRTLHIGLKILFFILIALVALAWANSLRHH